jgi:hypothetical protein
MIEEGGGEAIFLFRLVSINKMRSVVLEECMCAKRVEVHGNHFMKLLKLSIPIKS